MSSPLYELGEPVLRATGLSKLYARRSSDTRARLGEVAGRVLFGRPPKEIQSLRKHEFWALKDISCELHQGEALGIIGLNGSGKTTFLRILAGQILPDGGEVWINGSSAAMIDLQAGFQASASGQENIFLRAAALGFTRAQTEHRLNEIIEFSELGDAIAAPMSSYSSGMKMRLAFSVMAIVEPDVLFIDEVLAVGDFRFRQKCLARIREMRERSAFVFVSHGMGDIALFCDRVIVLHKGKIHFEGPPKEAIEIYESLDEPASAVDTPAQLTKAMGPTFTNSGALKDVAHFWCDESGAPVTNIAFSDNVHLSLEFTSTVDIKRLILGVPVWNLNAHYTTGLSTQLASEELSVRTGERLKFLLEIRGGIANPGTLKSMMTILDGAEFLYRNPNPDLVIENAGHPTWGVVTIPHQWNLIERQ